MMDSTAAGKLLLMDLLFACFHSSVAMISYMLLGSASHITAACILPWLSYASANCMLAYMLLHQGIAALVFLY